MLWWVVIMGLWLRSLQDFDVIEGFALVEVDEDVQRVIHCVHPLVARCVGIPVEELAVSRAWRATNESGSYFLVEFRRYYIRFRVSVFSPRPTRTFMTAIEVLENETLRGERWLVPPEGLVDEAMAVVHDTLGEDFELHGVVMYRERPMGMLECDLMLDVESDLERIVVDCFITKGRGGQYEPVSLSVVE